MIMTYRDRGMAVVIVIERLFIFIIFIFIGQIEYFMYHAFCSEIEHIYIYYMYNNIVYYVLYKFIIMRLHCYNKSKDKVK